MMHKLLSSVKFSIVEVWRCEEVRTGSMILQQIKITCLFHHAAMIISKQTAIPHTISQVKSVCIHHPKQAKNTKKTDLAF